MKEKQFDLIVIRSGSGGLGIALGMLEFGAKVLLVDRSAEKIGGECLHTGCIPSKSFLYAANKVHDTMEARNFGMQVKGRVDLEKVMEYVKQRQEIIEHHENVDELQKKGLHVLLGNAKFTASKTIRVNGEEYHAKNLVIATGSAPRKIPVKGLQFVNCYTNENIFEISLLPENFLFLGAGPVSLELGQAFSRLGCKVTIVDRGERILKKEDPVISYALQQKLERENINFMLKAEIAEILSSSEAILNTAEAQIKIPVDAVFMGLGRELNFADLDPEAAGITMEEGKIKLNRKLQTSNKNVFVSGDAAGNMKFSHAAEMHNMLLLNNFLSPLKKKLDFSHFSWVTFTDPEIATFGWTEQQLEAKNTKYERLENDFSESDRAVTANFQDGRIIFVSGKEEIQLLFSKNPGRQYNGPWRGRNFPGTGFGKFRRNSPKGNYKKNLSLSHGGKYAQDITSQQDPQRY